MNQMSRSNTNALNPPTWVTLFILVAAFGVSQLLWGGVIRPSADVAMSAGGTIAMTNLFVILKDTEQQICFALMLFCLSLVFYKLFVLNKQEPMYQMDFLSGHSKDEALDVQAAIDELSASKYASNPVMATWINCLRRFQSTNNVQNAAEAISESTEAIAMRLESSNNIIKFIIWAIPSIGFIGTVRGIGSALAQADQALEGDISGMVSSLGVAFNSTLVALFISIVLMFLMHLLNQSQDDMVLKTHENCEEHLLKHLHK